MPISALACRFAWEAGKVRHGLGDARTWKDGLLGIGLLLLPLAFAQGSNANTWVATRQFVVLWMLAAVVLLWPLLALGGWRVLTATVVAAAALTSLPVVRAAQQPYRQEGPVWQNEARVQVGRGGVLRVAETTADAVDGLQSIAQASGFQPGTSLIDLTGQAPGLVFVLSGRAANSPWVPGGYPGSEAVLRATLDRLPCRDVTSAWLLVQLGGPRSVADGFFPAVGASISDYSAVGSVSYPRSGSAPAGDQPRIRLMRSDRSSSAARQACEIVRAASS